MTVSPDFSGRLGCRCVGEQGYDRNDSVVVRCSNWGNGLTVFDQLRRSS